MNVPKLMSLCGLWKKTARDGKVFYTGAVGNSKIFLFRNELAGTEGQPVFNLYLGGAVDADTTPSWLKGKAD